MKIYTKTGDAGETGLFGGARVSKADPRVDSYGAVDEANACLGVVRAAGVPAEIDAMLDRIQRDLFALGAQLADGRPDPKAFEGKTRLGEDDITRLEQWIDQLESELPPLKHFILAGGSPAGAALHLARTVCRRAERRMVTVQGINSVQLIYVNRLSDLLFVIARAVNQRAGVPEIEW
ncbi:MAG: cob(I)yrinic acid a,c-diamide adenosyltransferase [Acidobacteria bacterium]|nr:cob(I)yrinic acid a,c-diamide adenosyltransferase [Acidobacteriota bacterium]